VVDRLTMAGLVLDHWGDTPDARIAFAVAYAESGLHEQAAGDHLSALPPSYAASIVGLDCFGYTSFGLWQIHVPAHYNWLVGMAGTSDPCRIADWLRDPVNNARAAKRVWDNAAAAGVDPWTPWTTYRNGVYRSYLDIAEAAIASYRQPLPPVLITGPEPDPIWIAEHSPYPGEIRDMRDTTGAHAFFFENFSPADYGG
jgi:hypothetical protein